MALTASGSAATAATASLPLAAPQASAATAAPGCRCFTATGRLFQGDRLAGERLAAGSWREKDVLLPTVIPWETTRVTQGGGGESRELTTRCSG